MRKKVLGRGLEALIPLDIREGIDEREKVVELSLSRIDPNPNQPRKRFKEEELRELAASIEESGVLQPVVVRRKDGRYELVVGERRLRASRMAGKETVPAIVRDINERDSLKFALLENLQREDLNPVEAAYGYLSLKEDLGLSVQDIGKSVGKSRSAVANTMRLLNLPKTVIDLIISGDLTEGHARAILAVEGEARQAELAQQIITQGLTVREIEAAPGGKRSSRSRRRGKRKEDPAVRDLEERLEARLGTRVRINPRKKGGVLTIEYFSNEQLEGILERIGIDMSR